jgi:very-short-patch-repair endonuclease
MPPSVDWGLAELAARQHGVVALPQLVTLGLSAVAVRARVARGKLHRIHRGVYAVGHSVLTPHGRRMAAVLACGDGAALSHRSAAHLIGIRLTSRPAIEVTRPRGSRSVGAGIQLHTSRRLGPIDLTVVDAIPCTTVARTLVDLAEVVPPYAVENAIDRAEQLGLFDLHALHGAMRGRHGARILTSLLAQYRGEARTKNDFEALFLRICRANGFPEPRVNVIVEGEERDFVWPARRLIVETDGRETHDTTRAFEEDRRKDQVAIAAGWTVLRFTWRQLTEQPQTVAATVRAVLTRPPS